ncbi:MAG: UDP-N-acetylglucosamine 1-carboxyvinyltransferase [candidate division Zixibacteria bacterium]|jgi:UDP-N-acetylglucosamine 1-carboxyvinyltransferase|nr:UDP-N-acetylglucosamine 1-carboxyvinyltransferase [candidate division Zixibacteria bacterium]
MDKFVIKGPAVLSGSVRTDGSKNAALPIMAGALLVSRGETVIKNVPPLRDINTFIKVLEHLGAKITYDPGAAVVTINAATLTNNTAPYELMRQMRASFLVLGPILSRLGEARVSLPGGCSLGARPVDFHIKAFAAMQAEIEEKGGYIIARGKPLKGDIIYFDRPSHTGTENLLYGAVCAKGKTTIINAACDPEVVDVTGFLNKSGAKIHGAGTPTITVEPVRSLKPVEYTVSGDRLVAGTYLIGAAMTGGDVEVSGIEPEQLTMVLRKLAEMGASVVSQKKRIRVTGPKRLAPVNLTTFPFPGFPTDLQACMVAAASTASGTSHIKETVFVDRFSHAMEFRRLGADIQVAGSEAVVNGVEYLQGAEVMAPDIRAGAGITLACLSARGKSEILRVYHIDRGYDRLEEKLAGLGADISRQPM